MDLGGPDVKSFGLCHAKLPPGADILSLGCCSDGLQRER